MFISAKIPAREQKMTRAAPDWSDARLNHLAAAIEPLPAKVAVLAEAVEHLDAVADTLQPVPAQVAVLAATVNRLSDENQALRQELAALEHQLLQIAWGLVAALVAATAALASALH
jgi:prefoldin subunit 5